MKVIKLGLTSTVLFLGLLIVSPAEASEKDPSQKRTFTKHFNETLFDITESAAFSVEVLLNDKAYDIGKDVIGIVVHGKGDKDVAGAELTIAHKNFETDEAAPGTITISDRGNGLYIISGLNLERDGLWELLIEVKKDAQEDSVRFIFPDTVKKRHPKGRYSP